MHYIAVRIDRLEIENFKKYRQQVLDLHPHFTLFTGENGAGKTTLLDALAVAAGIWLVDPPDSTLANSRREIFSTEIRLEPERRGDRVQYSERRPVKVSAFGRIGLQDQVQWTRQIRAGGKRTSNAEAKQALLCVQDIYNRDAAGQDVLCPILAYYGAGRAWLPSNERVPRAQSNGPARRWAAFYDCFNERIRFTELQKWFRRESVERGNRGGRWRPGFEVVRRAIIACIPAADDVYFDSDRDQVVLSIDHYSQPFDNLSAGQRMMLALVADIAIKCVTQNAFLVPSDLLSDTEQPEVFQQTPGLVLVDELDVHLHPRWQRRVATDLKRTFPGLQFVCTSHSPQVIGEVMAEELRVLEGDRILTPARAFGIDSDRVLEELMDASSRDELVKAELGHLFDLVTKEDFGAARALIPGLEARLGSNDPELTRARALMTFLESELAER